MLCLRTGYRHAWRVPRQLYGCREPQLARLYRDASRKEREAASGVSEERSVDHDSMDNDMDGFHEQRRVCLDLWLDHGLAAPPACVGPRHTAEETEGHLLLEADGRRAHVMRCDRLDAIHGDGIMSRPSRPHAPPRRHSGYDKEKPGRQFERLTSVNKFNAAQKVAQEKRTDKVCRRNTPCHQIMGRALHEHASPFKSRPQFTATSALAPFQLSSCLHCPHIPSRLPLLDAQARMRWGESVRALTAASRLSTGVAARAEPGSPGEGLRTAADAAPPRPACDAVSALAAALASADVVRPSTAPSTLAVVATSDATNPLAV